MKRHYFLFLAVLLVVVAAIPRAIELLNGNYLFGYDQGQHYEAVKKIVIERKATLIGTQVGGEGGFFQGPGWYYLLAVPFVLTRGDPYGSMVLMFLLGVATVIATIACAAKMFGQRVALITGFLITISPEIIKQSRIIWPPFPISLLSVFLLFFLFKVIERKERFLPLLTFTIGIMSHFEIATAGSLLALFVFLAPLLIVKKFVSFRFFVFSIASFLLSLGPLIIFDVRHNFLNARGVVTLLISGGNSFYASLPVETVARNNWNVFSYNFLSTFHLNEILWPVMLVTMLFGAVLFLRDKKNPLAKRLFVGYLSLSPVLLFIIFLFYKSGMWTWWLLELNIFYLFLLSITLGYLWKKKALQPFVFLLLLIFGLTFLQHTVNLYRNDFRDYGGVHKIKGKIDAIDYIYRDAKREKFGLFVFTPPIYTYAYDYLLWWYAARKYGYTPHQEKRGTFYLLIEPDFHKPWRHKGWIETVIQSGKIVKTEKLPSGFIIQKRIGDSNET